MYKWKGDCQLVPPYGFFAAGDDVSRLPQNVIDDMIAQGRIEAIPVGATEETSSESAPIVSKGK